MALKQMTDLRAVRSQRLRRPVREVACQQVIKPDIHDDAGIASVRRLELRAHFGDRRMRIGIDVDRAVQGKTATDAQRQIRIDRAMHEVAEKAADDHRFVVAGSQRMGKMVHSAGFVVRRALVERGQAHVIIASMSPDLTALPAFSSAVDGLLLPGAAGSIELVAAIADEQPRAATAVICHPHPLQGGTMHNKVVTMLERSLRELGLDTVRFNFRGVGNSEGSFDEGKGEGDDLATIVDWVRATKPGDAIWLAGFSFGSYVALSRAVALDAAALISIAPPVGRWDFDSISLPDCPWLIVQGEEDEVVDPAAVFAWVDSLADPPHLVRMPETGHFFHRRLIDLRGAVKNAARAWLPAARSEA